MAAAYAFRGSAAPGRSYGEQTVSRHLVFALLAVGAGACRGAADHAESAHASRLDATHVGQILHEEGCGRTRATCDAAKRRCERANMRKRPEDPDPLLVPCDLVYDDCLLPCRPGRAPR